MKNLPIIFILWILLSFSVYSQSFVGRWSLNGVREMAAGFEFRPDSTFQFFYSYGVSDRVANGTWKAKGDTLFLKSTKEAGKDFKIEKQSAKGSGYVIKVLDKNPMLVERIRCFAFSGGKPEIFESDRNGEIRIPSEKYDSLYLQHPFFPDIASKIKGKGNPNKSFEVSLLPSLNEVSFKSILFWLGADGQLHCHRNYFMPIEDITFEKAE